MAYIQPNKLLPPTSRVIRPYQCSFIATEGPNILGKLNMSGVEIPYYSQFTTRMTLNPSATKQPLLYGFLGSEVTFILLKFTYDETDPNCIIEEEQFVEYYYADQPSIIRTASKLLLLTGNSTHRIPQIFLNNPSEVKVTVDALVANLEQDDINLDDVNYVTISNIYYNSILSDMIETSCDGITGSTQLQVLGIDGYVQLYLDYIDILTIEPQYTTNEIKLTTISDTTIILGFLSQFEMYQALSRISWVVKDPSSRYLTKDYPGLDVLAPVFGLKQPLPIPNPCPYPFLSGTTILPSEIVNFFISGVTDARDGEISVDSIYISIRQQGYVEPITGITHVGVYDITMSVTDLANNQAVLTYTIVCDDTPPTIIFNYGASGSGFTMTDNDMALPNVGITAIDIINKSVDGVYDTVDGPIDIYNITILIDDPISGLTPMTIITTPGSYSLTYYVEDYSGNAFTTGKTLTYDGYKIIEGGETFIIPGGVVSMELLYGGETGTTATVVLSGISFTVANISGVTNSEFVWDYYDVNGTYHNFGSGNTGSITFIVIGNLFTVSFLRGSLYFTLSNLGVAPDYFEIEPLALTYSFETGLTNTFKIKTNLAWTINDNIDWLLLSSYAGTGITIITGITMDKNTTGYSRTGSTLVTCSGVTLFETIDLLMIQESETDYFEVTPTGVTFTEEIGSIGFFDITTNRDWTVTNDVTWLSLDSIVGTGNTSIICTTNEVNTTGFERSGLTHIIMDSGSIYETIDVVMTQESIPAIFSGDTYTFVTDVQLVYLGETETTATLVLSGQSFTIENSLNNTLIIDGVEFDNEGDFIELTVDTTDFEITFDGGNLVFTIIVL